MFFVFTKNSPYFRKRRIANNNDRIIKTSRKTNFDLVNNNFDDNFDSNHFYFDLIHSRRSAKSLNANTYDDDNDDDGGDEKDLSITTTTSRILEDYLPNPQPYRVNLIKEGNNNDESAILSVVYFILVVTVFVALLALIIMVKL